MNTFRDKQKKKSLNVKDILLQRYVLFNFFAIISTIAWSSTMCFLIRHNYTNAILTFPLKQPGLFVNEGEEFFLTLQ